jgi:hypothetical protein
MNRRVVLPASLVGLALCFAIIALPVSGPVSASRLQATQAADACNPEPAVVGRVLDNIFVLDQPGQSGIHLIKLIKTDLVEVLGKNANGFWLVVRSNAGIVGWAPSPQIFVDKKQFNDPKVVPIWDGPLPAAPEADAEATAEGTEDPGEANGDCPTIDAIIVADAFRLQVEPLTNSGDVGRTVKLGERVIVLALNASGSWAKVETEDQQVGWISVAYIELPSAQFSRVRKDYTSVEQTLTPRP